jgi:serine phosphatase RsbU (regulator of sigma subunit)
MVIDAIGHDLDAGIIAHLVIATYRWCRRRGLDLHDTSVTIDEVISERFPDGKFVTGILVQLDVTTGTLRWMCHGHPLPLLIRDDRVIGAIEAAPLLPLGLGDTMEATALSITETSLQPGDRILLYTDGIVEARTAAGQDFGLDRLQDFLHRALSSGYSDIEIVRRLSHAVLDHHGGQLRDDATTLLLRWDPQPERGA